MWWFLFFNFIQFVILENCSVLDLVLSGVKGLCCDVHMLWFNFILGSNFISFVLVMVI